MMTFDSWAEAVLADPLARTRQAERAIGYVGFDLPEDLFAATGAAVAHLPWDAGRPTPQADRWVEGSFAPWTRSILEGWAEGDFDHFESVVFSRGDDSAQRLYYYVTELQRRGRISGPKPLILDIARIPRASSISRTAGSLRTLAEALGVDGEALRDGIAATNDQRATVASLGASRAGRGSRYERIARASLFAPLPTAAWQDEPGGAPAVACRILLAGTAPPDDRLHRLVEAAGANIVDELHDRPLDRIGEVIDPGADPFAAVAAGLHAARFGPRSFVDPAAMLIERARRARADAVLLWLIEQEESIVWHVPSQRAALAQAGFPSLVLTRRAWDAADGTPDEISGWIGELGK